MKNIILLSDTHSYYNDELEKHLKKADEIWHAGDIGNYSVIQSLAAFTKVRAVYGNIDDHGIRSMLPKDEIFELEGFKIWITHIGSYPPRYNKTIKSKLQTIEPSIFICGHSHILKVIYDKNINCLHLNPGAIGKHGFHKVRTMLAFTLNNGNIENMNILEYPRS